MINPNAEYCDCKGTGTYIVHKKPKYNFKGILFGKEPFAAKTETLKCEYHNAELISYDKLEAMYQKLKEDQVAYPATNWEFKPKFQHYNITVDKVDIVVHNDQPEPSEPEPVFDPNFEYPDGWPEEDLRQWCLQEGVAIPPWAKEKKNTIIIDKWANWYNPSNPLSWSTKKYATYGDPALGAISTKAAEYLKKKFYQSGQQIQENLVYGTVPGAHITEIGTIQKQVLANMEKEQDKIQKAYLQAIKDSYLVGMKFLNNPDGSAGGMDSFNKLDSEEKE